MKSIVSFLGPLLGLLFFVYGCNQTKYILEPKMDSSFTTEPYNIQLPEMLIVNDSLSLDITEISNINWRMFLHYYKRILGEHSPEYKALLPDTSGYLYMINESGELFKHGGISKSEYFWSIEYDAFPVVGVTLEQAKKFTQWRADRVLEMLLVQNRFFRVSTFEDFTTDKFLTSEIYEKYKDVITYIPEYSIPKKIHLPVLKSLAEESVVYDDDEINSLENALHLQLESGLPIRDAYARNGPRNERIINLIGNVSEMIDEAGTTVGGNYIQNLDDIKDYLIQTSAIPDQTVGFRNVAKWVKIEKD